MKYAFPEDELRPVSCGPLTRDRDNPAHIELNDVLGNYSLTLIDSLSTLAILASSPPSKKGPNKALNDFQDGVALLVDYYGDGTKGTEGQGKRARGFDLDSKVQVFETVIRGVGGLLSAHLFATGDLPIRGYHPIIKTTQGRTGVIWKNGLIYDGQLLRLAHDLAERLLPAFHTATSIPYPRVNLRSGVPFYANSPLNMDPEHGECPTSPPANAEITETCSAGAGSLVLEFTTLSRLTGDSRFESAAKDAFWAIWTRRSSIGLIGSGIDAESGQWVSPYTGIGAGIDSFFEYAFKSYVMLSGMPSDNDHTAPSPSPEDFLEVWQEAHAAIKRQIYGGAQHPHYVQVDLYTGAPRALWIDSLSAYYPGLLTLAGELDEAITAHLLYTALWTRYSAIPERWSTSTGNIENGLRWWIGRPEFIESTWYLYRATKDPWYLHVGEMALRDIKRRCWAKCGWAGLQDVRTGEKMDRMESFFLGETAKYLFLLFDEDHPLNHLDESVVFTTEGHPLKVPRRFWNNMTNFTPQKSPSFSATVPVDPPICPLPPPSVPLSYSATAARKDVFHAASLARLHLMPNIETLESPLVEFTADHPSISLADLSSPSNYTYFPWTLPPDLVPPDAVCSAMASKLTFDLSFPNIAERAPAIGSLQRVLDGILVHSMSGLRLGMVKEAITPVIKDEQADPDLFRIYAVSNVALGRDEKVFMTRDLVSDFNPVDPYFTRIRDLQVLDMVLDIPTEPPEIIDATADDTNASIPDIVIEALESNALVEEPSILSTLLSNVRSLFADTRPDPPPPKLNRHYEPACVPTGPGAAPIEDTDSIPLALDDESPLPWHTVAFGGQLCGHEVLAADVPREHHVLVILHGGCSFSEKLRNIPSFAPSPQSLQFVVVISSPDDESDTETPFIQPYLDQIQMTPAGLPRPHPIPMVMVGGGEETLSLFLNAKGIGVRRRWWFESQGVRIGNLIVL